MYWYLVLAGLAILSKTRKVQCKYQRETIINEKLNYANTTDDFKSLRLHSDGDLYIDKSLFIKEITESEDRLFLFSRPPKFGKTVNMKMLETFFKIPDDEHERELNRKLFLGGDVEFNGKTKTLTKLKIANHWYMINEHLGKYPVIYLNFKNCSFHSAFDAVHWIKEKIVDFCGKRSHLKKKLLKLGTEKYFDQIRYLEKLIAYVHEYYEQKVVILIDDYDYAFNQAFLYYGSKSGKFESIWDLFERIFGNVDPENNAIRMFVAIGTMPMGSGLAYFQDYSVYNIEFSSYFGFTDEEVDRLLARFPCHRSNNDDIKNYYRGCYFGTRIMYNPGLILDCLRNNGALLPKVEGVEYLKALDQIPVNSTVMGELHRFVCRGALWVNTYSKKWYVVDEGTFSYLSFTGYITTRTVINMWYGYELEKHQERNFSISNLATKVILRGKMVEWISTKLSLNLTDYPNQLQDYLINLRSHDFTKLVEGILQKAALNNLFSGAQRYYIDLFEMLITHRMDYRSFYHSDPNTKAEGVDIVFAHTSREGCVLGVILTIDAAPPNNTRMMETIAEQRLQNISKMGYETELHRQNPNVKYTLKLSLSFDGEVVGMKYHKQGP